MAVLVATERLEQLVALVAATRGRAERERVRLVDDHQLGTGAHEVLAAAVGLDEVRGDDDVRVLFEERAADRQAALEPLRGRGQDEFGVEVELRPQLVLPLLGEVRRAEHGEPLRVAAVQQLASDQCGLDGLADADVVGDQQPDGIELERHQQRHELVGARLDRDATERPEGTGGGADAEPQRIAQQARAARVARRRGVRWRERRRRDGLELGEDPGDLVVGGTERTKDQQLRLLGFRENQPLASARGDERPDGVGHGA